MTATAGTRNLFVASAVLAALAFFALLQGLALIWTGGVFEYPLDDVYIHLAMAEGIYAGGYGVNPGEFSSAASSVLYPILLLPLVPPDLQRLLPLLWNIIGLVGSAWLWAELLLAGGYGRVGLRGAGLLFATVGPIALMISGVAFLGMEHALHGAASLMMLLGLVRFLRGGRWRFLLFAGVFLAPLLRYEGLALALLAVAVLAARGHWRDAAIAGALALLPLAVFSGFLVWHGLDPLPNSVLAKQALAAGEDQGLAARLVAKFQHNIASAGGKTIAGLVVAIWVMAGMQRGAIARQNRLLAALLVAAGFGHLIFAQVGWLNRYEHYILLVLVAGILLLLAPLADNVQRWIPIALGGAALVVPALVYMPEAVTLVPANANAIHIQQSQMSDFVKKHLRDNVAVNDLGLVSWNNPNYVLDLWGLASAQSLRVRLSHPAPGWAAPLVQKYDVPAALIYDKWLDDSVGADWVRLGELVLKKREGFLGSDRVAFYATSAAQVPRLQAALRTWVPHLNDATYFEYEKGME